MPQIVSEIIDAYVYRIDAGGPRFLVLRRAAGTFMGGTWHGVHGKIEPGETAWQAAAREAREETGLRISAMHQIDHVNTFYMAAQDRIHMCPCFAVRVEPGSEPTLDAEHDAYEWLLPEDAAKRLTWPGQREAVRQIVSEIIHPGPGEPACRIEMM